MAAEVNGARRVWTGEETATFLELIHNINAVLFFFCFCFCSFVFLARDFVKSCRRAVARSPFLQSHTDLRFGADCRLPWRADTNRRITTVEGNARDCAFSFDELLTIRLKFAIPFGMKPNYMFS